MINPFPSPSYEYESTNKKVCAVSCCLLGMRCRYDGKIIKVPINAPWTGMEVIPICPELMAGLDIPRNPCEILNGTGADVLDGKARIIDCFSNDKTETYITGAEKAAALCVERGVEKAYLKARSPMCGVHHVYDGSHSGKLISGSGVFAEILKRKGIDITEVDSEKI